MKNKLIALLLAAITLLSVFPVAFADGEVVEPVEVDLTREGEVISQFVSLYKENNSSSGYTRRLKTGDVFYIQEMKGDWAYSAVPKAKNPDEYDFGWIRMQYALENPTHIVLRDNSGVYAYAAPYNTEKRVGTVGDYDRFTVIATTGSYYIVSFRSAVCYLPMKADYWIEEDLEGVLSGPSTTFKVKSNNTKVYGYASTKHGAIDTFKKGKEVEVLYVQDGYAAIRYETVIAFIDMDKIEAVPVAPVI